MAELKRRRSHGSETLTRRWLRKRRPLAQCLVRASVLSQRTVVHRRIQRLGTGRNKNTIEHPMRCDVSRVVGKSIESCVLDAKVHLVAHRRTRLTHVRDFLELFLCSVLCEGGASGA